MPNIQPNALTSVILSSSSIMATALGMLTFLFDAKIDRQTTITLGDMPFTDVEKATKEVLGVMRSQRDFKRLTTRDYGRFWVKWQQVEPILEGREKGLEKQEKEDEDNEDEDGEERDDGGWGEEVQEVRVEDQKLLVRDLMAAYYEEREKVD